MLCMQRANGQRNSVPKLPKSRRNPCQLNHDPRSDAYQWNGIDHLLNVLVERNNPDVLMRVTIEALLQTPLIYEVANEPDATSEDEEPVENAVFNVLVGFLTCEGTAVAEQVHEARGDAPIDVEDEVGLLPRCNSLDFECVLKQRGIFEFFQSEVFDDFHTLVWVLERFNLVTNARNQLLLFPHRSNKFLRKQSGIMSPGELACCIVESTPETRADGQQTGAKRRYEILASPSSNDGVVRTRHGRPVIGGNHEDHFNELGEVRRELPTEPKKTQHASESNVLFKNLREFHASVDQFLATFIGDGGHEGRRLADEPELACPLVINGHLRRLRFGLLNYDAFLHQLSVCLADGNAHVVERLRHNSASLLQSRVLCAGSFLLSLGASTGVSELDFVAESIGAGARAQSNDWLRDFFLLESFADFILFHTSNFAEKDKHLDLWVILVAHEVVHECSSRVSVTTDWNAFVDAISVLGDDVVQLV
mmetsp:Transcript_20731/g.41867  ORF Transcript_20731/g.41867 Transcript_20731/m.41867 type:complete len:479 (+) Transcript_20731:100-1536(+)